MGEAVLCPPQTLILRTLILQIQGAVIFQKDSQLLKQEIQLGKSLFNCL